MQLKDFIPNVKKEFGKIFIKIDNLLFKNDYFIFTDQSGNIIVFSNSFCENLLFVNS